MRQIVAVVKDHPILNQRMRESDAYRQSVVERLKFIDRQREAIVQEVNRIKDEHWSAIQEYCEAHDLFPEGGYQKDKHMLQYDEDLGIILIRDKDEQVPLVEFLNNLFK
jgi:hypothetical protein